MIQNKTFKDKGLPARFLFANCRSLVGTRTFDKPAVNSITIENYNALIRRLLDGAFDKIIEPFKLPLTPEGNAKFLAFSRGIEAKLGPEGEFHFMKDWCAKLPGQMLRISGILALCDGKTRIDGEISERAAAIASWFTENAAEIYSEDGDDTCAESQTPHDILLRFINESTTPCQGVTIPTSTLHKLYKEWAKTQGIPGMTAQEFVGYLKDKGLAVRRAEGNVLLDAKLNV
jgi:hypothetical protein